MNKIRVLVSGANGRMGREVMKMVLNDEQLEYAGGVDPIATKDTVGSYPIYKSLEEGIISEKPNVVVDFTTPEAVKSNVEIALKMGVSPVVGTTGLTKEDITYLDKLAKTEEIGGIIAPNFAIGAVLMMRFAGMAAKYMPHVEIIELHHDAKLDAPSGTAIKTAELIADEREKIKQGHDEEKETIQGARGGNFSGFRIHSVRLPGLIAHQEVIFGAMGQTLTIRHDSISRESFMPGVNFAVKKVRDFTGIIYGLENLME